MFLNTIIKCGTIKKVINVIAYIFLSVMVTLNSCKKETSCEDCREGNKPPIANAGPDQVITLPIDSVSLDGRNSSDPDGRISAFQWTKISGPSSFHINNTASALTVVKDLVAGPYLFELKVTDNGGMSATDTIQIIMIAITTQNHPPIGNAGADQTITLPANTINLDGSASTDPDNNITIYTWTKISGPSSFNISNANTVQTQVTNLVQGVYQFELKVTDAGGLFSKDTLSVKVITDTLSGHEFLFNLIWGILNDGTGGDLVAIGMQYRPDLFYNLNRPMEVAIRLDTSAAWITVPRLTYPAPANNGYLYYQEYHDDFWVFTVPINYQLIGRSVVLKIRFL